MKKKLIVNLFKFYIRIRYYKRKFDVGKNLSLVGFPYVNISKGGSLIIGDNTKLNSTLKSNPIGRNFRNILFIGKSAKLIIGNNVKISGSALVAMNSIIIEDNVMIGGDTVIYDSDFHSLNVNKRINADEKDDLINKPVRICKNVFIGAHTIILKGVKIGENSVIGAGSVVFSRVPANQVWAGNPATFVYSLNGKSRK